MNRHDAALHVRFHARRCYIGIRQTAGGLLDRDGLDTAKAVDLHDLNLPATDRVRYEPSGWLDLRRALYGAHVKPDDVFMDIGSGKGRVLLQACRYPFHKVIGLEMSEELNRIARANLDSRRARLTCSNVELVTADILNYDIPDDVTVAYAFNPVRGDLFKTLAHKLIASVDRNPRKFRFIYNCAVEHDVLMNTGRYRLERVIPAVRATPAWSRKLAIRVYELV